MSKTGIRGSAIRLALASGIEYGLQIAMPVILVRYLDTSSFGQYRLLWLLASTAFAIAPCFMPQSLFYYLPRAQTTEERGILFGNTLLYLAVAGIFAGLLTSGWNIWLPTDAASLSSSTHGWSSVFVGMWVMASLFDVLPTADGNAPWQARATVLLALLRTALLAMAAILTQDVLYVILAMLLVVGVKMLTMCYYIAKLGNAALGFSWPQLRRQLAYAAPFALGNALFQMRLQADQWVVVATTSAAMFAMFSIATVLQPVSTLIRMPVFNAVMVHINSALAKGDLEQVRKLIAKSNGGAAFLLLPVAGGLFAVAPELVRFVYTEKYIATAPIMQVYLVGMMLSSFAVGHLLPALHKGRFATLNNAVCLPISVLISFIGMKTIGMVGAALGSVVMLAISEYWSARVVARALDTRVSDILALRSLVPSCLATLAGAAAAWGVGRAMTLDTLALLLLKGTAYGIVMLAVLFATGGGRYLKVVIGIRKNTI